MTQPTPINPKAIKAAVSGSKRPAPKAAFGDVLQGITAMGPGINELVGQWSGGSQTASHVLNAAFSGIEVAGGGGQQAGYGGYTNSPGMMGGASYTTQSGMAGGKFAGDGRYGEDGSIDPSSPIAYREEIMARMNEQQQDYLVFQTQIQTSMQNANMISNIFSADHRSRMAMIEKLTGRG